MPSARGVASLAVLLLALSSVLPAAPGSVAQANPNTFTVHPGKAIYETLTACAFPSPLGTQGSTADIRATPSGSAVEWEKNSLLPFSSGSDNILFFGVPFGTCSGRTFVIDVPYDAVAGEYTLHWEYSCTDDAGSACYVFAAADFTIVVVGTLFKVNFVSNIPATVTVDGVSSTSPVTVQRMGGAVVHYSWTEPVIYKGMSYDLITENSGTMTVKGDTTRFARYEPSTSGAPSPDQGSCPDGYIQGGLPTSPICYQSGMQVSKSGTVTTVDFTGKATGSLVAGDIATTGPLSMLGVGDQGTLWQIGPGTEAAWVPVSIYPDGSWYTYERTSSFWNYIDSYWYALTGSNTNPPGSVLATEAAIDHILGLVGQGLVAGWQHAKSFTALSLLQGNLHLVHAPTAASPDSAVACVITPDLSGCNSGSEYTVSVQANGTLLSVLSGTFVLSDLASNIPVTLQSGQSVFVYRGTNHAPVQKSFDAGSVNQWWTALAIATSTSSASTSTTVTATGSTSSSQTTQTSESTNTSQSSEHSSNTTSSASTGTTPNAPIFSSDEITLGVVAVVFLAILALAAQYASRGRAKKAGTILRAAACPKCGSQIGSEAYCESCGAKLH